MNRDNLHPADAPNPIVWCERCQRHHRHYTFTQGDYDALIAKGAADLARAIDEAAIRKFYGDAE
jgi:hypothetical protein